MKNNIYYTIGVSSNKLTNNMFRAGKYTDMKEAKRQFFNLSSLLIDKVCYIELARHTETSKEVIYFLAI